mmetsp:Transcript_48000/g.104363  ORF Transcript_48000/g.104363 Transcript_48000/m.104363 type:complete len:199 (+) Transcript_48000:57-653(+)
MCSVRLATISALVLRIVSGLRQPDVGEIVDGLLAMAASAPGDREPRAGYPMQAGHVDAADLAQKARASVESALQSLLFVGGCTRQSTGCPDGYVEETGACVSMADVDDPDCRSVLLGLDQEARAQFALRCRAGWPCKFPQGRNYSGCPVGWEEAVQNTCRAPHTYTGVCGPAADFADMFDGEKAEWAAVCGVQWPEVV